MTIYEQLREAVAEGVNLVIDLDLGSVEVSADEALEVWEDMAPGEGFEIIKKVARGEERL